MKRKACRQHFIGSCSRIIVITHRVREIIRTIKRIIEGCVHADAPRLNANLDAPRSQQHCPLQAVTYRFHRIPTRAACTSSSTPPVRDLRRLRRCGSAHCSPSSSIDADGRDCLGAPRSCPSSVTSNLGAPCGDRFVFAASSESASDRSGSSAFPHRVGVGGRVALLLLLPPRRTATPARRG